MQCASITDYLKEKIDRINQIDDAKVLIDITVMTRHRLALILNFLIKS